MGAVELRNVLHNETGVAVPATFAFDHPTVASMAALLSSQAALVPQSEASIGTPSRSDAAQAAEVLLKLQDIAKDILGARISASQPLMEVRATIGLLAVASRSSRSQCTVSSPSQQDSIAPANHSIEM